MKRGNCADDPPPKRHKATDGCTCVPCILPKTSTPGEPLSARDVLDPLDCAACFGNHFLPSMPRVAVTADLIVQGYCAFVENAVSAYPEHFASLDDVCATFEVEARVAAAQAEGPSEQVVAVEKALVTHVLSRLPAREDVQGDMHECHKATLRMHKLGQALCFNLLVDMFSELRIPGGHISAIYAPGCGQFFEVRNVNALFTAGIVVGEDVNEVSIDAATEHCKAMPEVTVRVADSTIVADDDVNAYDMAWFIHPDVLDVEAWLDLLNTVDLQAHIEAHECTLTEDQPGASAGTHTHTHTHTHAHAHAHAHLHAHTHTPASAGELAGEDASAGELAGEDASAGELAGEDASAGELAGEDASAAISQGHDRASVGVGARDHVHADHDKAMASSAHTPEGVSAHTPHGDIDGEGGRCCGGVPLNVQEFDIPVDLVLPWIDSFCAHEIWQDMIFAAFDRVKWGGLVAFTCYERREHDIIRKLLEGFPQVAQIVREVEGVGITALPCLFSPDELRAIDPRAHKWLNMRNYGWGMVARKVGVLDD